MDGPVVVVGAGLAGTSVARELRKLDPSISILVLSADRAESYAKPTLSNALASHKEPDTLVQAKSEVWGAKIGVDVQPDLQVRGIDPSSRTLDTSGGTIPYRALVLAVGASPVRLSLGGNGADRVHSVNSLSDYRSFREDLRGARSVAVIGGGLVGCEFADDLRAGGYEVRLFDPSTFPLGRLLPEGTALWVRNALEKAGIFTAFNTRIAAVDRENGHLRLTDSVGKIHDADVVLSAVGLRPNLELAQTAGITVRRGIAVDRHLETSVPGIYALGDCAEVEGLVLPFVQPVLHGAKALARTLWGTPTELRYPAMPVVVKTPSAPVVVCPPPQGMDGIWHEEVSETSARASFLDPGGNLLGFALAGDAVREKADWGSRVPDWL